MYLRTYEFTSHPIVLATTRPIFVAHELRESHFCNHRKKIQIKRIGKRSII